MKAKRYFKILSVFLSMLMLISVIPINGAAIEKIDASSDTQNEAETKLASDGEILYEINDKRTQNSKTYKKATVRIVLIYLLQFYIILMVKNGVI